MSLNMATLQLLWVVYHTNKLVLHFQQIFTTSELKTHKMCAGKLLLKPICYPWKLLVRDLLYLLLTLPLVNQVFLSVVVDSFPC